MSDLETGMNVSNVQVDSGVVVIQENCIVNGLMRTGGGTTEIQQGGIASNITLATNDDIDDMAEFNVHGVAINTVLKSGGQNLMMHVWGGGTAINTIVSNRVITV